MKADHILDYLQSVIGVQYDRFVASDEPMKPSPGRTGKGLKTVLSENGLWPEIINPACGFDVEHPIVVKDVANKTLMQDKVLSYLFGKSPIKRTMTVEMEHNGRKVECVIAKVYDKGNEDFTLKRVYFSS